MRECRTFAHLAWRVVFTHAQAILFYPEEPENSQVFDDTAGQAWRTSPT